MNASPQISHLLTLLESIIHRENKRLARTHEVWIAEKGKNFGDWSLVFLDSLSQPALMRICLDLPCYEVLPFFGRKKQAQERPGVQQSEGGKAPAVHLGMPSFFRRLFGRFRPHILRLEVDVRSGETKSRMHIVRYIPG